MSKTFEAYSTTDLDQEVANLTSEITKVKLHHFQGSSINALSKCRQVEQIEIYAQNPHEPINPDFTIDISVIGELPNLKSFTLTRCPKLDIAPLLKTTQLTHLYLSGSHLDAIDFLRDYTNLKSLGISGSTIERIDVIANFPDLDYLHLSENNIVSIAPLKKLSKLTRLYLADNKIADFSPIYELKSIISLDLKGNVSSAYHEIPYIDQLEQKDFTLRNYSEEQLTHWEQVFNNWAEEGKFLDAVHTVVSRLMEIHENEEEYKLVFEAAQSDDEPLYLILAKNTANDPKVFHEQVPAGTATVSKISTKISIFPEDYPSVLECDLSTIKEKEGRLFFATIGDHEDDLVWNTNKRHGNVNYAIERWDGSKGIPVEATSLGQVIIGVLALNLTSESYYFEGLLA